MKKEREKSVTRGLEKRKETSEKKKRKPNRKQIRESFQVR